MHLQIVRHGAIDGVQEGAEIFGRVARPAFAHHPTRVDIEGCERVRGAVADIVMRVALDRMPSAGAV